MRNCETLEDQRPHKFGISKSGIHIVSSAKGYYTLFGQLLGLNLFLLCILEGNIPSDQVWSHLYVQYQCCLTCLCSSWYLLLFCSSLLRQISSGCLACSELRSPPAPGEIRIIHELNMEPEVGQKFGKILRKSYKNLRENVTKILMKFVPTNSFEIKPLHANYKVLY